MTPALSRTQPPEAADPVPKSWLLTPYVGGKWQ